MKSKVRSVKRFCSGDVAIEVWSAEDLRIIEMVYTNVAEAVEEVLKEYPDATNFEVRSEYGHLGIGGKMILHYTYEKEKGRKKR